MEKTRGIILLSLGSPYYMRMAANLAFSLKVNTSLPVHLFSNNHTIPDIDLSNFDKITVPPESIYMRNGRPEYFRAKTCLYDLSPFDETIYLDVDMVALPNKKFDELFQQLAGAELVFACRGSENIATLDEKISQWASIPEIVKVHDIKAGSWYQLSSEFIYFKKTEGNKKFFDTARAFYDAPKVNFLKFGGCMADELAFGAASMINNHYPAFDQYTPIYWPQAERHRVVKVIDPYVVENYYAYSMGHAYNDQNQKGFYNNMMQFYYNAKGRRDKFFPAQNKKLFVPDRERI